jgi:hypothetical protein
MEESGATEGDAKLVGLKSFRKAMEEEAILHVEVVEQAGGGWYLRFQSTDPKGNPILYALRTHHSKQLRVWKTPGALFKFLKTTFKLHTGHFLLEKGNDEKGDG